ncbi:MAG: beta-ketoacyl-[acyl-carrier-protein] synthase II [Planctomycetes bacterium TMED75]|nr:beta-ketoacyl-[acyl-carrier-protein] synthase II [Planctomycetaceae bacterium]OUU94182.1 MAG: beta-ketoacyl-[acyl-carrier-protein] synthase II [Planctomycetes bacterium TMED75]
MSTSPRVVVTGMGWITPLGCSLEEVWSHLVSAGSGMAPITRFDASTFPTTFAAEVKDYDFAQFVRDPAIHATAGLNTRFALGAARQAWQQSRLDDHQNLDRARVGLYLGAGEGVLDTKNYLKTNLSAWNPEARAVDGARWIASALKLMNDHREIEQEPNMPIAHLAREFEVTGPAFNCLTACAASTQAIGEACDIIRRGEADVMISGGTHTMIHPLGVTGFNRLTALSTHDGDPAEASRPFDRTRGGFVMGEGSGIVTLERLDHALARGAVPLAEIIGYGSSCDAFRITDIQPDGRGAAAAMNMALSQAGIDPLDASSGALPIDYVSAHGTGTQENDSIETRAIKRVFGELAPRIPMSSIKSMMGHLIAAAGAVELITCILAIRNGELPPTRNLHTPDDGLDLDYVPNASRKADVHTCLSNNFGFGGQNDTLIVTRYSE